jgi:spermidine synthase
MVAQAGPAGPTNCTEVFTALYATVASVFPQAFPYRAYVPSFGTLWGFVIGGMEDATSVATMTAKEIDSRVTGRLASALRFYDGVTHAGLFNLPKYLRQALSSERRLITKDSPLYAI